MTRPYSTLFNWPNLLTLVRIGAVPLLVIFFYMPTTWAHLIASLFFTIAALTDWLDGYLARYLKQSTKLGAFLDPVADKLMVSIALVLIVAEPIFQNLPIDSTTVRLPAALMTIPAAIIVAREIIVSALREWMAEIGKRSSVTVSSLAKFKTAAQMFALIILLYCDQHTGLPLILLGCFLLYMAAILTIWSMCIYLKVAWSQLVSA
jgi:CDP-diacylglycerol--glycerol-3-phosphate 3-phosphatidyltransferase